MIFLNQIKNSNYFSATVNESLVEFSACCAQEREERLAGCVRCAHSYVNRRFILLSRFAVLSNAPSALMNYAKQNVLIEQFVRALVRMLKHGVAT